MDFIFNEDSKFKIENETYVIKDSINTLLLTSLFTDSRINNKKGYWLPTESSGIWSLESDKVNEETLANIAEQTRLTLNRLKGKGYFNSFRIETELYENSILILVYIKIDNYNEKEYKFVI